MPPTPRPGPRSAPSSTSSGIEGEAACLSDFLDEAASRGLTSIKDAGGNNAPWGTTGAISDGLHGEEPGMYLYRNEGLPVRIAYHQMSRYAGPVSAMEDLRNAVGFLGDDWFKYLGPGEDTMATDAGYADFTTMAARKQLSLETHVGNVDAILAGFEAAAAVAPVEDLEWRIAHPADGQPTDEQLARAAALDAGWILTFSSVRNGATGPRFKSVLDAGAKFCLASDAMNVAPWQPFQNLWYVTTGDTMLPGVPGVPADQQLTRLEALRHQTVECDWAIDQEGEIGSLEVGKLADLLVLDQDYFTVPDYRIRRSSRCSRWSAARSPTPPGPTASSADHGLGVAPSPRRPAPSPYCGLVPSEHPTTVVLFGATGDLARRKLLPGLLHLFETGLLRDVRVVGTSLDEHDRDSFVDFARTAVDEFAATRPTSEAWPEFAQAPALGARDRAARTALRAAVEEAERGRLGATSRGPGCTTSASRRRPRWPWSHLLREADLVERSRIIMEKPFGTDLASARELNSSCTRSSTRTQIFRIDHFLGKEAAQNILAFRFANGLFEPIWHRNHIDHVQIDVPETLGLEQRASFYEATGAYRDMVVTHLFQVLAFTAMEPPTALEPYAISEEKNKVFRSMLPIEPHDVVRGQYVGYRDVDGRRPRLRDRDLRRAQVLHRQLALGRRAVLPAHRQADGRGRPDHLDRLQGAAALDVPGRLRRRRPRPRPPDLRPRRPGQDVAVVLRQAARPGHAAATSCRCSSRCTTPTGPGAVLEAYERLIYDAARGDRTLFTSAEGIERLWEVSTPLLENPPRRAAVRPGLLGTQPDPPAGRAVHLAAALRAQLARPERRRRLTLTRRRRRTSLSRKSSRPSWPPSRPMPLCLMPPNGAAGSETRPRLRPTMPASSRSLTRRPRARSPV